MTNEELARFQEQLQSANAIIKESEGRFIKGGKGLLPDLFLLDVMLPDGNGIDVCEMLKTAHQTRSIPVLMMSAHSSEHLVKQSCRSDGFVAKPFDINELKNKVTRAIETQ